MSTTIPTAPPRQLGPRRITLLVALAVFAQESMWNFYDSQVPPLLREHLASAALVGFIMGMDNLLGIFIQPWMANRSDRTRTRWGRRMPYLAVGMPLAALLFVTLPHTADSLPLLIVVIVAFALVSNSFKPIGEALVPDFIAPERRSRANAAVKIASVVVLWNLAPSARVFGTYAALYAVGWQAGAFLGPALIGGAVDVLGWPTMLLDIAVVTAGAVVIVVRIDRLQRRGDAEKAV
ncbi:MFS transporter [Nocardioides sp. NPDC047086]|uniref:MFS transporter n=1 Tax=Nocardioides sp. NPDC047086 TaxID=3154810 RepID=UPI00340823E0